MAQISMAPSGSGTSFCSSSWGGLAFGQLEASLSPEALLGRLLSPPCRFSECVSVLASRPVREEPPGSEPVTPAWPGWPLPEVSCLFLFF